jgi:ribosomal protein S17
MPSNIRHQRKERVGVVISDKMAKTISVKVGWETHHPVYREASEAVNDIQSS